MDFSDALRQLKAGKKVTRKGWHGKGMWLAHMPATVVPEDKVTEKTRAWVRKKGDLKLGGHIVLWTSDGSWQPGWLASQADMLSEDWALVD